MPHFGLMDEMALGPVRGPLQRARLHLRGGRRRLRQGKISAGIVTLYDAVEAAMRAFVNKPGTVERLGLRNDIELMNERLLYQELVRSRVLDGSFDFDAFDKLTGQALDAEMPGYDYQAVIAGVESVLLQLGVLPFDESSLPPEDPKTF